MAWSSEPLARLSMYWKHHPLSFVSGPSYTRKQSYISACRSPAGFIRGARGHTGWYIVSSVASLPMVKTEGDPREVTESHEERALSKNAGKLLPKYP